jgi:predicted XRE-type DNA-binding protein
MNRSVIEHETPVGGNIFADLGFAPDEATALHAESQRRIADALAIKMQLMSEIQGWIVAGGLTQQQAAEKLHVSRPRITDVVGKKGARFSIDTLIAMVERTGKRVTVQVCG